MKYMQTVRDDAPNSELTSDAATRSKCDVSDNELSSDDDGRPILTPLPGFDKPLTKNGKRQSFHEVLGDILKEGTEIPSENKLGPKPWLHRPNVPKLKTKYQVSQEPFIFKPRKQSPQVGAPERTQPGNESQKTQRHKESQNDEKLPRAPQHENDSDTAERRSRPPSRGSACGSGSEPERKEANSMTKDEPELETTPSFNAAATTRLPPGDEAGAKESVRNARELATAALKALSLTKDIVESKRKRETSQNPTPSFLSDDNLYDTPRCNDVIEDDDKDRKVISVPAFIPPPDPVRNDKDHPMSAEPVYDVKRSSIPTPANVSEGALDLMYQLFGNDLDGNNSFHTEHSRPGSTKSVTFENGNPGEAHGQRAPSRPGSVCSEWSDCTINMSEYPESEATTLPSTTIDFPEIPQIGLQSPPLTMNSHVPNNFHPSAFQNPPMPQYTPSFTPDWPAHYDVPHRYPVPYQGRMPPNDPEISSFHPQRGPTFDLYDPNFNGVAPWSTPHPEYHPRPHHPTFPTPGPYDMPQHRHFNPPHHAVPRHPHPGHMNSRSGSRYSEKSRTPHTSYSDDENYFSRSPSPPRQRRHQFEYDVIGTSYINGYKAAMQDAVKAFTENQLKQVENPKETEEERMHRALRRVLSSGRIDELPDNVELGDIRKAFSKKFSDHDDDDILRDVTIEDFVVPDSGRPLSRRNSMRRRSRHEYDAIDDVMCEEEHSESCDCSECEDEMERRNSFHEGEIRRRRERRRDEPLEGRVESVKDSKLNEMRQRYLESMESTGNGGRRFSSNAPHGMNGTPRLQGFSRGPSFKGGRSFQGHPNGFQNRRRNSRVPSQQHQDMWERQSQF